MIRQCKRIMGVIGALVISSLALTGCSMFGGHPASIPDHQGLYAYVPDEGLQRLDGDRDWQEDTWSDRSGFGRNVQFVVYNDALRNSETPLERSVRLTEVAWRRSEVSAKGDITPAKGDKWVVTDLKRFQVPLKFQSVPKHPGMVRAVPAHPLKPGLYSLSLTSGGTRISGRLGVAWDSVDQQSYSASTCVDQYMENHSNDSYFLPCSQQDQALLSKRLKIYLVKPQQQQAGDNRTLVLQGVVVNNSNSPQPVPRLEARLVDDKGGVLKHWRFSPQQTQLQPGESAPFSTEIQNPPANIDSIQVLFAARRQQ